MNRLLQFTAVLASITLLATACARAAVAEAKPDAYVVAVNNPLAYFAERLAGDAIEVRMPAPGDVDPAIWQPDVEDILLLQGAQRILLNGAGYSPWLDKIAISRRTLVVSSERADWIALEDQVTHSHGPRGEHAHGGYAVTTWLDIELASSQAEAVAGALATLMPERAASIGAEMDRLRADLAALDQGFQRCARGLADRQLIYSHPVYQYFERRYELSGTSLHWEPDTMPTDVQWTALDQLLGANALFVWESEPADDIVAKMATMQLPHVVLNPAANRGEQDWLAEQQANLSRLESHCTTANDYDPESPEPS